MQQALFRHDVDTLRVLVANGQVRLRQLRICGLTENDLFTQLRQRGVYSLEGIRYVLYEAKGSVTVVPDQAPEPDPPLVRAGLEGSVDYP